MSCAGCDQRRAIIVAGVKRLGKFINGVKVMADYKVLKQIQYNGAWYEPGDDFEEDERLTSALLEAGAIEAVAAPETAKA